MKTILRFLKPRWTLCVFTILLSCVDVAGALIIPTYAADMLNVASTSGSVLADLIPYFVKIGAAAIVSGAAMLASAYLCSDLTSKIGADMRKALYEKSTLLSSADFRLFGAASMTTRTVSDVANVQMALGNCFQILFPAPLIFIASTVFTFRIDWFIGLIFLAVFILVSVVSSIVMFSSAPIFRKLQRRLDKMSKTLLENLTGVRVIRAFNNESREEKRLVGEFDEYARMAIKVNKRFASLDGILFFTVNAFVAVVYFLSGFRITAGAFEIGDIAAVIEYAMLALFFLMMAQMVILTLPRALECCDRAEQVLSFVPSISDSVEKTVKTDDDSVVAAFVNASFRYPDSEEYVLKNLNFECRRGETTAIIGGTGSGKSTIASLITRFNDVTDGQFLFKGRDVREMSQKELRDGLAYVQQSAWLFSGTIAENLRYGNLNATDEELYAALETAQAKDFVEASPLKLETRVARGGTNFSGGQRQRLSIARALVKSPDLYVFDDSFSALDFKTDAALRKALKEKTKNSATVIIAQRVSTITSADNIIALQDGEPVGMGKHEDLLKNCPTYLEIYQSQTKEEGENE